MLRGQNIQVFVRCRPLSDQERRSVIEVVPERREIVFQDNQQEPKNFYFDHVFSSTASQLDVYKKVVSPLIDQVLQGFNCTVFAYGQTGTGKTYTMEGLVSNEDLSWEQDPHSGIIPRIVSQLLDTLKVRFKSYTVRISFLELYNEDAYDLLSNLEDITKLKVFDDIQRKGSVIVGGLEEVTVNSKSEIYELLSRGSAKRQKAATLLNACSSRSHTIFTITVNINQGSIQGKLNLVDLAGSENIGRSGAQDKRAREAGNINQSLLTLGRVITALVEKRPHIPYRESKLTRILQDSLGGSASTTIIATISPSDQDASDTLSTLDYATRARNVINKPESNQRSTYDRTAVEHEREIQALVERHAIELCELEFRVRNEVATEFKREITKMKDSYQEQYAQSSERMKESYESQCEDLRKQLDELRNNYKLKDQLAEYRKTLNEELETELRNKEKALADARDTIKELTIKLEESEVEVKKATKVRKAPVLEECSEYANLTFDGGDEITQMSAKKTRKKVVAGTKRRNLNQSIVCSGKKKKLTNNDLDAELSPITAPTNTRVTRSRATRRKLDF